MIVAARDEVSARPVNRRLVDEQLFLISSTRSGNEFVKVVGAVVRAFAPVPATMLELGGIVSAVPPARWESEIPEPS